jgi:hypothetical protein
MISRRDFLGTASVAAPMRASLLVFISVAAFSSACQPAPPQTPGVPESPYRATATVREIMQSVVAPSAQGLWDAVGTVSNAKGTVDLEPKTDAEWAAVRRQAIALVESTNLLLVPGRRIAPPGAQPLKADEADPGAELPPVEIEKNVLANWPAWTAMAHTLHDAAMTMLKTIDNKDAAGLLTTGSDLDGVCESCHLTFWYPPKRPQPRATK